MNEVINWLSLLYRADVLGEGSVEPIMRKFSDQLVRKPSMATLARSRRDELARVVASRGNSAYVEKKQVDYLDKAFAGMKQASAMAAAGREEAKKEIADVIGG